MCARLLLVVTVLLVTWTAAVGQNSIEYGKLPMVPPELPSPASKLASRVGDQSSAPKVSVIDVPSTKSQAASRDNKTRAEHRTAATPKRSAIFILSSGERLESDDYLITHDSVQLTQNGVRRTIRMSGINVQATSAANKQRGLDLKIPSDKSEMVIAF